MAFTMYSGRAAWDRAGKITPDMDGDGLPDSWEFQYFGIGNLNQTGTGDYDGDGLTNLQEYQQGTNPTSSDTDGDGVNDYLEWLQGRNPLVSGTVSDANNLIRFQVYTPLK